MPRILGPREKDGRHYRRGTARKAFDPIQAKRATNEAGACRAYYARDHRALDKKVALRRWLLTRMGFTEVSVLDACSGSGLIWTAMEPHVSIQRWVRCDIQPRPSKRGDRLVLKMSAAQAVASMDLSDFTVTDIDPYGEPWEAYRIVLERFTRPMAVFLTHGRVAYDVTNDTRDAMGIPRAWSIPQVPATVDFIVERTLEDTWRWARLVHAARVVTPPTAGRAALTYYALGIEPR